MSNLSGMEDRYSVYFSHSWRAEHVDLNQIVWKEIHTRCNLLVDENKQPEPPYYINRIEEYIRRSDLFLALLTYRDNPDLANASDAMAGVSQRDLRVRCSTASLFEVRLAERARKPRLILYDIRTRFEPGSESSPLVCYQPFEEADIRKRDPVYLLRKIRDWLDEIGEDVRPRSYAPNQTALVLLSNGDQHDQVFRTIDFALRDADYNRVVDLREVVTDVQVLDQLFSTSLLVAEIGQGALWDIYAMAHALFVPTIRLVQSNNGNHTESLPWLLRGHPKGYQEDLVRWTDFDALGEAVSQRAKAMRDTRTMIASYEAGHEFFERRRYKSPHRVFISHNLKGEQRNVIEAVMAKLNANAMSAWEYATVNRSGENWQTQMRSELSNATHAVIILADGYELSEACTEELEVLLSKKVPLFPFFWGSRRTADPHLQRLRLHHASLDAVPETAASQVMKRLLESLTAEPAKP